MPDVEYELSDELLAFIKKWKGKRGNLIMVLHKVQKEFGFVPREIALKLTQMLNVPLAKIYGVITFYHFFRLQKPGKNLIAVCMGTACYLKGGEDLILDLERTLGVGLNTVTQDGLFSVEAVRCIGCCGLAPVMTINDKVYGNVKKEELPKILAEYSKYEGIN